jgi:glycosyltransferase involved in cell wall biosynthesis
MRKRGSQIRFASRPGPRDIRAGVTLIVVHYHFRPGGIRRVIELATPAVAAAIEARKVVLATGEPADACWEQRLRQSLGHREFAWFVEPAFHYLSAQTGAPAECVAAIRQGCERLLAGYRPGEAVIWVHNFSVGRNPLFAQTLARTCEARGLPFVSHHHDWWFEQRWARWPEMQRAGVRTLRAAAEALFAVGKTVRHVAINGVDARLLAGHLGDGTGWLPNPAELAPASPPARVRAARAWLTRTVGQRGPVWVLPCRLLRRKNVAEALLLTRWLRPEAVLVTTGDVSSTDEAAYAHRLGAAAARAGWPLRLSVLAGDERGKPSVLDLLTASECVLLTSILEGFGLPFLEAAAAGRPLLARRLPNIAPDLARFGFRFPQAYDEVRVPADLFDLRAERERQARAFRTWKRQLPTVCRRWVGEPMLLAAGREVAAVPFSRLTLTAQLAVLAHPPATSWEACRPLNPFLEPWRQRAARQALAPSPWPRRAESWLGAQAYARRFLRLLRGQPAGPDNGARAVALQQAFLAERLGTEHLFPLLWNGDS